MHLCQAGVPGQTHAHTRVRRILDSAALLELTLLAQVLAKPGNCWCDMLWMLASCLHGLAHMIQCLNIDHVSARGPIHLGKSLATCLHHPRHP